MSPSPALQCLNCLDDSAQVREEARWGGGEMGRRRGGGKVGGSGVLLIMRQHTVHRKKTVRPVLSTTTLL